MDLHGLARCIGDGCTQSVRCALTFCCLAIPPRASIFCCIRPQLALLCALIAGACTQTLCSWLSQLCTAVCVCACHMASIGPALLSIAQAAFFVCCRLCTPCIALYIPIRWTRHAWRWACIEPSCRWRSRSLLMSVLPPPHIHQNARVGWVWGASP